MVWVFCYFFDVGSFLYYFEFIFAVVLSFFDLRFELILTFFFLNLFSILFFDERFDNYVFSHVVDISISFVDFDSSFFLCLLLLSYYLYSFIILDTYNYITSLKQNKKKGKKMSVFGSISFTLFFQSSFLFNSLAYD